VRSPDSGALFLLAAAALVAADALTATHLQNQRDPALLLAAGMPMIPYWTPTRCHASASNSSAARLDHADLLALLDRK
jgi:hypothetical protein